MTHKAQNFVMLLFVLVTVSIFVTCNPNSRRKVLSTIFDGVPKEEAIDSLQVDSVSVDSQKIASLTVISGREDNKISHHPPYQKKACGSCHDPNSRSSLIQKQPLLCYNCHDDFSEEYTFLHGPVASGYCTECHNPHGSKNPKLLVRSTGELCFYCHQSGDVYKNEEHEDVDSSECLDCHNPHGGDEWALF